ncbi:MAG TPA: hypothetical protein VNA88_12355 [Candidatus Kapabacteria bacterium]|nr:hypothetical protein [Candidatus Kapabacteria bacterium]
MDRSFRISPGQGREGERMFHKISGEHHGLNHEDLEGSGRPRSLEVVDSEEGFGREDIDGKGQGSGQVLCRHSQHRSPHFEGDHRLAQHCVEDDERDQGSDRDARRCKAGGCT